MHVFKSLIILVAWRLCRNIRLFLNFRRVWSVPCTHLLGGPILYRPRFGVASPILNQSNGCILKANLSWTRKKSNSSDTKKFVSVFGSFSYALKAELQALKFEFCHVKLDRTTDKLAINWQNFARVELQLKFVFGIRL